ncbi:MAG: DUF5916 domain-containing protein [Salinibacter sp.]|uniref:carbohydrate binding family 9 domain-containing protein n=1 Tax=Salinibacter sp. TaxID=2065818 RepID=UPI002FC28767
MTRAERFALFGATALFCVLLVAPATGQKRSASAEEPGPTVIPNIEPPIELDGRVGQGEWRGARRLPLVQQKSNFGAEPDLKTEILVAHTAEAVYLACRCYDPQDPTVTSFKRDGGLVGSDGLRVLLDTFNDEENGLWFALSPTGNRVDGAIFNDATGASLAEWFDLSWNTYWDVEVRQTEDGWFAEMRIPASSLRFEPSGDRVVMGLTAWRWVERENENFVFPAISLDEGQVSHFKPSNARDAVFNGLTSEPPLRVTPYVLGGIGRHSELNQQKTAYQQPTDLTYDVGLDVKYGLTPNFTLDLTVNTDFAQVEADNQQVNLTRFPLFFPEKRRFFLERASNFAFNFGAQNRLFYSRRIGLHQGRQVRILGGARVVGRSGPWDVGALSMQTAREPELGPEGEALPSENFGVLRVRREVLNAYSEVGGILTSRIGLDGSYNLAYGLDGTVRPLGEEYFTAKWAQTFSNQNAGQLVSFRPARIQLGWERRTYEGLSYDLRYDRAGRRYEPGLGFELREDFVRLGDRVGYGWLPGTGSPINRHQLNLRGEAFFHNDDGSLQSLEVGPEWSVTTSSNHEITVGVDRRVEDLRTRFSLTDEVGVPPGRHAFLAGKLTYRTPRDYTLRISAQLRGGGYFDGRRGTAQVQPVWNPSRYLQVEGFYQLNRVAFPDRGEAFTAHVGRLRLEVTPNVEYSISAFVQHNSARGAVIGNLRFRYNPRQGNDLYVVYNERLNSDRSAGPQRPRLPRSAQRAVVLKYNYTFNW